MDAAAAGRVSPHIPVDSAPIEANRCLSKCALITIVAIGAIVCVGLCFIPPIGVGVGLGVSIFAIVLLTSFLIGCCSPQAGRAHDVYVSRRLPPPILVGGSLGSSRGVIVVDSGHGARHHSRVDGLYPQRAPVGGMTTAGAPPPPGYDSPRFDLHQQGARTAALFWSDPDNFSTAIPGHRSQAATPPPPVAGSSLGISSLSAFHIQGNGARSAPLWGDVISDSLSPHTGARAPVGHRGLRGAPPPPGNF